jgi:geranylgeranyl pyrophosphate synthase
MRLNKSPSSWASFVQDLDLFSCLNPHIPINFDNLRNIPVTNILELKNNIDELKLEMTEKSISALTSEINGLVSAGGKKFRPGLMFLMGEVFNLNPADLKVYARAVELTHLASLIHDDVIDESDKRRNHPTLNSLRNNTTAILAGDFVLATVMGELASANNNELLKDLTKCIQDLADGEWLQYDLKSKNEVSFGDLELVCIKKTGSLIRFCCTTPAKLSGHKDIKTMATLGERIGLIFQMADDIVDGFDQSGRPAFQDIINGQFNYVTLQMMELYPELAEKLNAVKNGHLKELPWSEEQYLHAVKEIHLKINNEKNHLLTIFSNLCKNKNQNHLIELFELSLNKIQNNYANQLSL